jgi:hypothetical protein
MDGAHARTARSPGHGQGAVPTRRAMTARLLSTPAQQTQGQCFNSRQGSTLAARSRSSSACPVRSTGSVFFRWAYRDRLRKPRRSRTVAVYAGSAGRDGLARRRPRRLAAHRGRPPGDPVRPKVSGVLDDRLSAPWLQGAELLPNVLLDVGGWPPTIDCHDLLILEAEQFQDGFSHVVVVTQSGPHRFWSVIGAGN